MKKNLNEMVKGMDLFKGNVPKKAIELTLDDSGKVIQRRQVDHYRRVGNRLFAYHCTKGFRAVRDYKPHTLLNNLLQKIGIANMYDS